MANKINMIGKKFGRLTVIEELRERNKYGKIVYKCQCECGNIVDVVGNQLRAGQTKSCGCLQKEKASKQGKANAKHHQAHTRLYHIYQGMKQRCYNKNALDFANYGGRGVKICDEWLNNPTTFFEWAIDNGYQDNLTIDRIDVNKSYAPCNCKWATRKQQTRNRRNTIYLTYECETQPMSYWAAKFNKNLKSMYKRYHAGWNVNDIIFGRQHA